MKLINLNPSKVINIFLFIILCISTFKGYFFTFSLLIIGLILIKKCLLNKQKKAKIVNFFLWQLSLIFLFFSLPYTLLNFIYNQSSNKAKSFEKDISVLSKHESKEIDYFQSSLNNKLGYEISSDKKFRARAFIKKLSKKNLIYDSIYTINKYSNRVIPENKNVEEKSNYALFSGCSITFGEGLNDDETISNYFTKISKIPSINTAVSGYGPHQTLMLLQDEKIFKRKSESKKIKYLIYRLLPNHINRAAGNVTWDTYGPCYKWDKKSNNLIYKGPFIKCKSKEINFVIAKIMSKLGRNEPISKEIASSIILKNYRNNIYSKKDYRNFTKIIKEINDIANKNGIKFFIILEDMGRLASKYPCSIDPFTYKISSTLESLNIDYIRSSSFKSIKDCNNGLYEIPEDSHPSALNNLKSARALNENLKK